jgi:hypothetical protein
VFHSPYIPLEALKMLSEALPDAMDNKGVIRGDHVKWFNLYMGMNRDLKF